MLTNVIKRNWLKKGRTIEVSLDKETVKHTVLEAVSWHNMSLYKHFNSLLQVLTRHNYPANYPELHNLLLHLLDNIANMGKSSFKEIVEHPQTMPVLSMSKAVIKEYCKKRISHTEEDFRVYISQIVSKGVQLA